MKQPLQETLKQSFGFTAFQPLQEEIVRDALEGGACDLPAPSAHSIFVRLHTGCEGGASRWAISSTRWK